MLKGTTKIELTDVHTGEKQTIVEHNMITNALTEIFRPLGINKSPGKLLNNYAPYYQKLLGGLLLFDTNIEENPDNFFPPANAQLIGCGAYGVQNNTTGTCRGGYNQTESEFNTANRYVKYVYDFATSQANGTISCVCLTHVNGGFTSYGSNNAVFTGNYPLAIQLADATLQYVYTSYTGAYTGDKYTGLTLGKTEVLFVIDRETDAAYYFRIDSSKSIHITRRRAYLKTVSVFENPYLQKALIDDTALDELGTAMATNYFAYNFDHADNCLYIFSCSASYRNPGDSFLITKISMDGYRIQQYTMTNTTSATLNTSGMRYAFAHNGFVYLRTNSSPYLIYKFEIANAANVVKIKYSGMTSVNGSPQIAFNGRIFYENAYNEVYIVDEATNEALKPESNRIFSSSNQPCYTPMLNEPLNYFCSYGNWSTSDFMMLTNYLATINNLPEPVTKTADKTMKVTYIIQEQ